MAHFLKTITKISQANAAHLSLEVAQEREENIFRDNFLINSLEKFINHSVVVVIVVVSVVVVVAAAAAAAAAAVKSMALMQILFEVQVSEYANVGLFPHTFRSLCQTQKKNF